MKFSNNTLEYLVGKKFSNSLTIDIAKKETVILDRFSLIENYVKGKKIIHLGCCDHVPLIKEKIKNNFWLHASITNNSNKTLGIDINKEGIKYLTNELNITNCIYANIIQDEIPEINSENWDYIIAGEIIEHLDNPVEFLKNIHFKFKNKIQKIIITVPNAFCYTNLKFIKKKQECINTDHRYWFTPFTLAKILTLASFQIEEYFFCQPIKEEEKLKWTAYLKPKTYINYFIYRKNPILRETIFMVAKF